MSASPAEAPAEAGVALRPAAPDDAGFFRAVYASTRDDLAPLGLDDAARAAFVDHQFAAQTAHYARYYAGATVDVVLVDGEPAGRLYVHRGSEDIRIVDIALLPAFRGRGAGGALLAALMDEARASGRTLSIHVEKQNPARALYDRLGFAERGDVGSHWYMVWDPAQPNTAS